MILIQYFDLTILLPLLRKVSMYQLTNQPVPISEEVRFSAPLRWLSYFIFLSVYIVLSEINKLTYLLIIIRRGEL